MTEPTTDQLRAFDRELRQRDPRFLRVVEAAAGTGTYELRSATTGATARATFTFCKHGNVLSPRFDAETHARLTAAAAVAPDPYAEGLAKLRAAAATPASRAEDDYKTARMREVMVTREALDAEIPTPRLTAAELSDYRAPDPYREGLERLRLANQRRASMKETR